MTKVRGTIVHFSLDNDMSQPWIHLTNNSEREEREKKKKEMKALKVSHVRIDCLRRSTFPLFFGERNTTLQLNSPTPAPTTTEPLKKKKNTQSFLAHNERADPEWRASPLAFSKCGVGGEGGGG